MYDGFADSFAVHAEGSAHNAHYALTAWCAEFREAGFLIERLVEPLPAQSMKDHFPDTYHQLTLEPFFIVFVLVKTPASAASEQ